MACLGKDILTVDYCEYVEYRRPKERNQNSMYGLKNKKCHGRITNQTFWTSNLVMHLKQYHPAEHGQSDEANDVKSPGAHPKDSQRG